jgi:hypothetical protein
MMVELFMNKLILLLLSLPLSVQAIDFKGPIGDSYDSQNTIVIKHSDKPLYLTAETYLRSEKIVLDRSIVTNGFGLVIEARELVISPDVTIKTFDRPYLEQTFVDNTLKFTMPRNACSTYGTFSSEIGKDGPVGRPGLDAPLKPHDIKIFATLINGELSVSANGQQGGKGGAGGGGGKGLNGCKGADGKASCSGLWGTGNGNSNHGEPGKNGAYGGLGGVGGVGGKGSENGQLLISYLHPINNQNIKVSSNAGIGGEGGEPGTNGVSGDPGAGGDSDKKECGTFWDKETVKANAGRSGISLIRYESSESLMKRRGQTGLSAIQIENSIKLMSFEEIKAERDNVISSVMEFHFARVFYQLTQQSLMIIMNLESLGIGLTDFHSINEAARGKLIQDWKSGFIEKLSNVENLSNEQKELISSAKELVALLEVVASQPKDQFVQKLESYIKKQKNQLGQKIKKIASACYSFLEVDSSEVENKVELFSIPLCVNLQELTANPMAKLIVTKAVSQTVAGISKDNYVFEAVTQNKSRRPTSDFEVIVVNNKKYGEEHFKQLYQWHTKESLGQETLRTLTPLKIESINLNNIGSYARLLSSGMAK